LIGIRLFYHHGGCLQDGGIKGAVIPAPPYSPRFRAKVCYIKERKMAKNRFCEEKLKNVFLGLEAILLPFGVGRYTFIGDNI